MTLRDNDGRRLDRDTGPGPGGPDSAGQAGDTQGLSHVPDADGESVEELADAGQAYEADAVTGVEDAADHPERATRTHEAELRPRLVAPDRVPE